MSHVPVETVEEDAADLQFPKGRSSYVFHTKSNQCILFNLFKKKSENSIITEKNIKSITISAPISFSTPSNDTIHCNVCHNTLSEPYITCAECKSTKHLSCLKCFAVGAEIGNHLNSHAYIITHDNVKVFPNSNWSAREERKLLELLMRCGFGNWADISRAIGSRNAVECRDHYLQCYFDGIFWKTCGLTKYPYERLTIPYLYRQNVIEPPRYYSETVQSKFMAGYRYARSDFDTPFDVSAESVIANIKLPNEWDDEYREISELLNGALGNAYNHRLR